MYFVRFLFVLCIASAPRPQRERLRRRSSTQTSTHPPLSIPSLLNSSVQPLFQEAAPATTHQQTQCNFQDHQIIAALLEQCSNLEQPPPPQPAAATAEAGIGGFDWLRLTWTFKKHGLGQLGIGHVRYGVEKLLYGRITWKFRPLLVFVNMEHVFEGFSGESMATLRIQVHQTPPPHLC